MRAFLGFLAWVVGIVGLVGGIALIFLLGLVETPRALLTPEAQRAAATAQTQGPQRVCPPTLTSPGRAFASPRDDLFGVRRGRSVQEAQELLQCRDGAFRFSFEPIWHTPLGRSAQQGQRQLMHARRPGESIVVGLVGPAGEERVAAMWRDQSYGLKEAPDVATVVSQVQGDFGAPHKVDESKFTTDLVWTFAPDFRPMSEAARAQPQRTDLMSRVRRFFGGAAGGRGREIDCAKTAPLMWLSAPEPNPACGITIMARIDGQLDDPRKASRLRLVVIDQKGAAEDIAAFRQANNVK